MARYDYFVFDVTGPADLPARVADLSSKELVRSFPGTDRTVLIYRQARPTAASGG